MGDGARHDRFESGLGEEGQTLGGAFEPGRQAVEFGCYELAFEIPGRRIAVPAHMRRFRFIGADENAIRLFAQVGMGIGVAHHRQFRLEIDELLQRFGDRIVMQHIGDRHIMAGPGTNHIAI